MAVLPGEAFRFPLRTLKMKLDSALLVAIALKENATAQAYTVKENLLYNDCKFQS
jgi:hypothetical protein